MTSTPKPLRILLVEDHELSRQGLAYSLKTHDGFDIIGQVENGAEAVAFCEQNRPDIILMDIIMPVLNGIEATKCIKQTHPETKVIMLTSQSESEKVFAAFASGADSYCMKDIKLDELIHVIRMVSNGAVWLDPSIASYILERMHASPGVVLADLPQDTTRNVAVDSKDLTEREIEVLKLIAEGMNNKDIAESLYLSIFTVKNHVSSIIQKLSVEDRTQAAIFALKHGLG